ncbi:uncharacterized protein [Chelonus insularis]|uniref:uncharacterized protein n=1 Tax=Chelonus insularis TaxID=460826 RepID=UPI00158F1B4D|nr:uncharacterized protein LOC118074680 [Chelonus insularis]
MGSSRPPDRSLSSGISFPQWMKGKVDTRFDFDQGAFSPPSHDDSFFYIPYTKFGKQTPNPQREGFQPITSVLNDQKSNEPHHNLVESITPVSIADSSFSAIDKQINVDLSKHPPSCQSFVPLVNGKDNELKSSKFITGNKTVVKSQGVDNELHSEAGLCGKSIVNVATRIMSHAMGKKVDSKAETKSENSNEFSKGSKSLPVSPISTPISTPDSSPKSRRRLPQNRFFTGAFIPERDKQHGWILSSILSRSREIIGDKINEEEEEVIQIAPVKPLSRKKSISTQDLTYIGVEKTPEKIKFQAEPSELREMNFWSPTSM